LDLIGLVRSEKLPECFELERIIVVASGCVEAAIKPVRGLASQDSKILLIEEPKRRGKADAINKIIRNSLGRYIVFINADAVPARGALVKLLQISERSNSIGMVTGSPILGVAGRNATSLVEDLMWRIHCECSARLNNFDWNNHGSDEMMIVRSAAITHLLPRGIVNDGAYIGSMLKSEGYSIKFCRSAKVKIDAPGRVQDLIRQRQRIVFGHFQVWRLTGRSPKTVESLLLLSPLIALGIIVNSLAKKPRLLWITPVALVCELASLLLALKDTLNASSSSPKHEIWTRYANK
jgi:cellulose synthase/poly-beta-1,6-N-acetylglucosamine synthase-like glycosyltransferase